MPHELFWYVEKRLAQHRVYGEITLQELASIDEDIRQFIAQGDPLVHVLVDMRDITKYPTNLIGIRDAINLRPSDPKTGWVVIISPNIMVRFVASVIAQLVQQRIHTVASFDQALDFLKARDDTLNLPVEVDQG